MSLADHTDRKRGLLFVLSAPAGTGKTTLINRLCQEHGAVARSISYTTRAPRPNEKNGEDYIFVSRDHFLEKIAAGNFLEYASLYGEYYGTSRSDLERCRDSGKHVFLIIDIQGAQSLRKLGERACYIFLMPPSLDELKKRLSMRNTETIASVEARIERAEFEMQMLSDYDYAVVNGDLQKAVRVLLSIVIAEEHKVSAFLPRQESHSIA